MIVLAHDGSIYGDWVAKYALRFATQEDDRKLVALHVCDGKVSEQVAETKLAQLGAECRSADLHFSAELLPLGKSVHRTLRQAIPHDPEALLVCGTRYKPSRRSFLSGSVAEKLLRMHQCPILALRVVQPGLLGNPHDLLLPLAGHLDGFRRVWPIFRRFLPQLEIVHLFRALPVHHLRQPHLTPTRERLLRRIGRTHLDGITASIEQLLEKRAFRIDQRVMISSDWPNEILIQACRLKIQLLLVGVSERSLAHRVIHGAGLERILRETPCDVGIYRGP